MKTEVEGLTDEELMQEFVYWFRVHRNEGELKGEERNNWQRILAETKKRKLVHMAGS